MSQLDLDKIVRLLAAHQQRATYGAVAGVLNRPAQFVMQGAPRTHLYSWAVNAETLLPTGYTEEEMDPRLLDNPEVIMTSLELEDWIRRHAE